jgi:hypothetical protein
VQTLWQTLGVGPTKAKPGRVRSQGNAPRPAQRTGFSRKSCPGRVF